MKKLFANDNKYRIAFRKIIISPSDPGGAAQLTPFAKSEVAGFS